MMQQHTIPFAQKFPPVQDNKHLRFFIPTLFFICLSVICPLSSVYLLRKAFGWPDKAAYIHIILSKH